MIERTAMPSDCEQRLDDALEESFPASDPPFFVGAGAAPGPKPPKQKKRGDFGQEYGHYGYFR